MGAFQWDQCFVTELPTVDQQHRRLVDIINQFGALVTENELVLEDIEGVFQQLSDYAEQHFEDEEKLISQYGVDERHTSNHIREHQSFLQDVVSMHASISEENPDAARNLLAFLTQWLTYHILGSDQDMARQIKAIETGSSPSDAYESREIGQDSAKEPLLTALNELFQQVSARNKELVRVNQTLELKVAERTKELMELNLHLEELALTDALTGLPNRRHAIRWLKTLWSESLASNSSLSCMMIDADHFKEVNDTYGHDAGDEVLCQLAKTLQHSVRNDDVVCRLGGDEFLIICPNTDNKGGMIVAELTRDAVSNLRVPTGETTWKGSVSIGLATRSYDMQDHEDLIRAADTSVYQAKRDGKNCVRTPTNPPMPADTNRA